MVDRHGAKHCVSIALSPSHHIISCGSTRISFEISIADFLTRQARVVQNKVGRDVTGVKWSWPQVAEAFKDPQLYFCLVNAFLSSVPNGALTTFGSIIMQSFGFTELQVLLVEIPRSG